MRNTDGLLQAPKATYKAFPVLIKSHKLTLILDAPPDKKTVAQLKEEVLSALTSNVVNRDGESDVPEVENLDDFEICRELKERKDRAVVPTGKFEALDENAQVAKQTTPYEPLFLRFKKNGEISWLKPEYTLPPLNDDEGDPEPELPNKGKRKAID
ncbi:uncharacterized protein FOMMEDRAFT_88843 [Fomitiporia mediterranea MF3/22]|uniref:uncharacterized protein n=1 Tax=Fomitiporia mediterranea (strain MF3/22) TaxID=694068 RepID=UPI000440835C|nr:uncharacterized protein FOMMEDRAFT_88843 [Fomitiporia mediterranea MF3/22]EJD01607.1 hypothetical protein FOMMEDRAFT_88843 [Fomitiporia mediterranea MF3/22]